MTAFTNTNEPPDVCHAVARCTPSIPQTGHGNLPWRVRVVESSSRASSTGSARGGDFAAPCFPRCARKDRGAGHCEVSRTADACNRAADTLKVARRENLAYTPPPCVAWWGSGRAMRGAGGDDAASALHRNDDIPVTRRTTLSRGYRHRRGVRARAQAVQKRMRCAARPQAGDGIAWPIRADRGSGTGPAAGTILADPVRIAMCRSVA